MSPKERRERILDLIRQNERVTVDDLADQFRTSKETIRRDLTALVASGAVRKYHGGATLPERAGEGAFAVRMGQALKEKRAVAQVAASLFGPGDTLFVDTGSTTIFFAEELAYRERLTVITNSQMVAQALGRGTGTHKIFLLGGEYNSENGETLGALVLDQVRNFNAEHAVITIGGLTAFGALDFDIEESRVARAMVEQCQTLTVIADGSKFDRSALFRVCDLSRIQRLVVDRPPTGKLATALSEARVDIIVSSRG